MITAFFTSKILERNNGCWPVVVISRNFLGNEILRIKFNKPSFYKYVSKNIKKNLAIYINYIYIGVFNL